MILKKRKTSDQQWQWPWRRGVDAAPRASEDRWRDEDSVGLKSISGEHRWLWDRDNFNIPRAESLRTLLWDQRQWTRPFIIKRLPRNVELEFWELQQREISNWGGKNIALVTKSANLWITMGSMKTSSVILLVSNLLLYLHGKRILFVTKFAFDHPSSD